MTGETLRHPSGLTATRWERSSFRSTRLPHIRAMRHSCIKTTSKNQKETGAIAIAIWCENAEALHNLLSTFQRRSSSADLIINEVTFFLWFEVQRSTPASAGVLFPDAASEHQPHLAKSQECNGTCSTSHPSCALLD